MKELSILIPVFNDKDVLNELYCRLSSVINEITHEYEIIFVDDGSSDDSVKIINELQIEDYKIKVVVLTRNFGQSNAIAAGLEHCQGETIVIMDSDLEDRPEDIPKLLDALTKNDEQMIIAQRSIRKDSFSRKMLSWGFFKVSHKITNIKHPENLGVFRAFKRTLYKQIIRNDQLHGTILSRFYSAKIPFRTIDLIKYKRFAGKSGYTFRKRFKLALDRLLPHLKNEKLRQNRDPYFVIKEIMEIKETK